MPRERHPEKDVEAALREAERLGWTVVKRNGKGHAWGLLRCPLPTDDCRCGKFCQMSISSTPQNAGSHAAKLIGKVRGCTNPVQDEDDGHG